jgi:hypothetical protein
MAEARSGDREIGTSGDRKPVAVVTNNTFKARDIPDNSKIVMMVNGPTHPSGLIVFVLLPGSPLRKLLELQEIYQESWEMGRKAREADEAAQPGAAAVQTGDKGRSACATGSSLRNPQHCGTESEIIGTGPNGYQYWCPRCGATRDQENALWKMPELASSI